jgi:hypothetical protein
MGSPIGLPKLKPCKKPPFAIKMPVFLRENAGFQTKFVRDLEAISHVAVQSVRFRAH